MPARPEPLPAIEVADARIAAALVDPSVRDWVKTALATAAVQDPVDAAADAALVAQLLGDRVDAMLADLDRR